MENSRLARYEISDPYLRFHFTFVRPNNALLEQGRTEQLMRIIGDRFDSYVGHTGYEELCRRVLIRMADKGEFSFCPEHVGRVWTRSAEIDIAALDRKRGCAILGECKWTGRKVGIECLEDLERKMRQIKRIEDYKVQFALFSKKGFDLRTTRMAARRNIMLFQGLKMM